MLLTLASTWVPQLYGTGADLVPVTLKFEDVNGDHLPDMIVMF